MVCLPVHLAAQESVYSGAFPGFTGSMDNVRTFEQQAGKGLSIVNIFRNWEDGNGTIGFPTNSATSIRNHGSMPMFTWQPQGHRADSNYRLDNIINGNWDNHIRNWALGAKAWGHPFFLRFAHEMNGTWYPWGATTNGNTPAKYVAAWRHVRDIFTRNGVTNVTWVWTPNTVYSGAPSLSSLYPGDNYVDWTGVSVYNRISNNWGHFSARGGPTFTQLLNVAPGKPIMIAETGCHRDNDKPGVPAGSKAQWFRTAMKSYLKDQRPEIKAWVYFNGNNPDGNNWRINSSPDVQEAYRESIGLSYYSDNKYGSITESPIRPLVNDAKATDTMGPFVSIDKPAVNKVYAGMTTEIHTSASDKSGIQKIEYSINGVLAHTENLFPYQYFWPVPSGAGISYTIVCKAYDTKGNTTLSTIHVVSAAPPAAPSGVAASDGAFTDKVRVTWNSAGAAIGYDVWRNTTNTTAGAVKLNAAPVTGTTFDDATVPYSTPAYYWVRSVDDAGPGPFSASDTGYRDLPEAPVAPTGLYATDGTHNNWVRLGWNGPANAAGYEIWRNTVNNSATAVKITGNLVTGTIHDDTTAAYAVTYYYWARAVNDGGASPFSGVATGYRGNLPTISDITDRTINQLADTGAVAFTIGDAETPAANLILTGAATNTTLVPEQNIVFGGSGAARTVTVTPAAGQYGVTTITVTVTDADGGQKSDSFVLTVNALPGISAIGDRAIGANANTGAIAFTVSDVETTPAALTVGGASSNTTLVPNANIVFGGGGSNRTVTITPAAGQSGTAEITITVSDGTGSSTETFFLSVLGADQGLWTATSTGPALDWTDGANWFSGSAPQSGASTTLTFLSGSTLPPGSIVSNNNISSPFPLNILTLSGDGPAGAASTVNLTGGALQFSGSGPVLHLAASAGEAPGSSLVYQIGMPVVLSSTTLVNGGGSAEFVIGGNISGGGGLSKSGNSTFVLAGSNSYTGQTVINGGTGGILRVTSASGLGSNGALLVNTGSVSPLIQFHIDGDGSDGTIAMSNGFGGNSNITTTIDVGNNGGGNTGNTISLNGTSGAWGNNVTLNVTGSNGYGLHFAQLRSTGGSSGTETLNPTTAPLTIGTYLGANSATTLALGGTHEGNAITGTIVNGNSTVSIVKSNTGTWLLEGNNTYTGATTINGGALVIASDTALGAITGTTTISSGGGGRLVLRGGITVAEPISVNGRNSGEHLVNESGVNTLTAPLSLNTGGNDYYIRSDSGRLAFGNAVTMVNSSAWKTLHVSGGGDVEMSGTIGNENGTLGIGKTGPGTLILSGTQNHNGATTINGGTVIVNGDLTATSGVTVASDAKLSGSGTISSGTSISGIHAPGSGIGRQTFAASLAYTATSRLEWELAANHADVPDPGDPEEPEDPDDPGGFIDPGSTDFDSVSAESVAIADGAVIDIVLDAPGSAVDFTDGFWLQQRSWPVLSADSVNGSFTLGAISNDAAGLPPESYGGFSLQTIGSTVHVVWTPESPFLTWRQQVFGDDVEDPDISGEMADPDHDGLPNLIEYALGTSPVHSNGSGITLNRENDDFTMTYTLAKSATDITAQPLWSTDLIDWSDEGVTLHPQAGDEDFQTIEARVPIGDHGKIFMKLLITRP